jgi:hypothetical protein
MFDKSALSVVLNKPLVYSQIGEFNSLSLGFGSIVSYHEQSNIPSSEYQIISYERSWRIVQSGEIILSGLNLETNKDIEDMTLFLLGEEFVSINLISRFDIEIESGSGVKIQFFGMPNGISQDLVSIVSIKKKLCHSFFPGKGWVESLYNKPFEVNSMTEFCHLEFND